MRTEDGHIIYKCLNGDSAAFGLLIDKYKESVYALAYSKLHNFHDAEDVTQEVFIRAYQKLRTLRRYDSFLAWLYCITSNQCKMLIRERARRPDHEFIEDQDLETLEKPSKDSYRQELARESVHEALDSLPEMYRQALILHYLAGMTSMEIARFVGASPAAIRMRLSKARALLREEMLDMMKTTFGGQRLQAGFTFRIVEAVKRMKIQPLPRTAGLPWGLSLATGIVLTVLSLNPHLGVLNRGTITTGSGLPVKTKVMKAGEIPVDVLKISQPLVLAGNQGDSGTGEPELPDQQAANLAAANSKGDTRMQEAASDKGIVIDPETGVKYTKTRTLTGKKDVIQQYSQHLWAVNLSANGKFLLWDKLVVPLDGGEPFDLVDMPAHRGIWSPDGKKVVFRSGGATWVIPVSPETGRPTDPAKKLLDVGHSYERCSWSPDSERIVIERRDKEAPGNICILSVTDGTLTQITNWSGREWRPIWSPDGKTIAYNWGYQLRVIPAEGGSPRKLIDKGRPHPVSWSPDSEWLVYLWHGFRFLRLADGREFVINPPKEVGGFISWSSDGKKMLFYRSSYDWRSALKVVPASGGPSFELGGQTELWPYSQYWSPDSKMIVTEGEDKDGEWCLWIVPLAGGDPFLLELDVSVVGKPHPLYLSPDRKKLAFVIQRSDEKEDLYVVPISLKDGRTTGSAVIVFSGWDKKHSYSRAFSWSPDGTKIAVSHEWNIWMASAEGGEPVQVTFRKRPGHRVAPGWSPDGKMIYYKAYYSDKEEILRVIPASGSEDTIILDIPFVRGHSYEWSPDSRDLLSFSEGVISATSVADGKSRQILDLKELSIDDAWNFSWSPDRQKLAFIGGRDAEDKSYQYQIFMAPAEGGKFTELAADDHGDKYWLRWSPDGKWISYNSDGHIKTRPGGEIWEADVSDFLSSQEREQ